MQISKYQAKFRKYFSNTCHGSPAPCLGRLLSRITASHYTVHDNTLSWMPSIYACKSWSATSAVLVANYSRQLDLLPDYIYPKSCRRYFKWKRGQERLFSQPCGRSLPQLSSPSLSLPLFCLIFSLRLVPEELMEKMMSRISCSVYANVLQKGLLCIGE